MSFVLRTIYPTFSVTNNHKWKIPNAISRFNLSCNNYIHQKKSQTPVTKAITSPKQRKISNNIIRVTTEKLGDTTYELEKKQKGWFWFRKWDSRDIAMLSMVGMIHALGVCAPFVFDWDAFIVAVVLSFLNGFGITLGYHRLLSHQSFKVPKWLEYFFAYCGVHAFQKDPIFWVSAHKHHHANADTEKDPYTPSQGFWFSYFGWFLYGDYLAAKCGESRSGEYSNVPELKAQWFYTFLLETYFWHPIALATILYIYGGFPYLAWGMGMRGVFICQSTFFGIPATHTWGERPWNTPDTSTNNGWIAMLSLGEGWHNNHHAFPKSARHGLEWWQFDLTWELIKFLELVGLATDVKLPTEDDKRRKAISLGQIEPDKLGTM